MKRLTIFSTLSLVLVFQLAGCGQATGEERTVVDSPKGRIADGQRCYNKTGQFYVKELAPRGSGKVAVFLAKGDREVQRWDLPNGGGNEVKGMFFLTDARFGVVYHFSNPKSKIFICELHSKAPIAVLRGSDWYHYFKTTNDPDAILVSKDGTHYEKLAVREQNRVEKNRIEPEEAEENPTSQIESEPPVFYGRRDALYSPNGSVDHGARAFSLDGKYFAAEIEPYGHGNIAVFAIGGELVQQWKVQSSANDLKALAWSPDSKKIGVVYHGGATPGVQVLEPGKKGATEFAETGKWYHYMIYDDDNETLLLKEELSSEIDRVRPKKVRQ